MNKALWRTNGFPRVQRESVNHDAPLQAFPLWARYLPLIGFQLYLTLSVLAFAFGPLEWQIDNPLKLYCYVFVGQAFIFVGYYFGISKRASGYQGKYSTQDLLKASILITVAFLPPTLATRNRAGLSVSDALAKPATAFEAKFDAEVSNPMLSIPRTLLAPILALLVPLGIVRWRTMTVLWRALWLCSVCGQVVTAFYTGRAYGIFEIMLVVPWMLWLSLHNSQARSARTRQARRSHRISAGKKIGAALSVLLVLYLSFSNFVHSRKSRLGDDYPINTTGWSEDLYGVPLPESMEFTTYYVTRYLTIGYYGLSGSLELPFEWTGGIGHSAFLRRYAGMVDSDFENVDYGTYPARLEAETGYSSTQYWHTIYPWLASDLTFFGALLFVGLMGFLLARAWADSLVGANPFALGFLGQILLLFYYIPANNLRMANPEASFALWGLFILWQITRGRQTQLI